MKNSGINYLIETTRRDQLKLDLTKIFDEVAKAADKIDDVDTKVALKVAAARGKEKVSKIASALE
jgi:hypothetical protein